MKKIDLTKSVYDLTELYPELIDILKKEGFLGVGNPVARNTLGRVTTIPEGCSKQGKELTEIIEVLREAGFEVTEESEYEQGRKP